jgi:hypothetical protein
VKLRGFYSPQFLIPILNATIDDPSPVNYPDPAGETRASLATGLTDAQRDDILTFIDGAWERSMAAGARSNFVDGTMLIWALQRARQAMRSIARGSRKSDLDGHDHDRQDRGTRPGQSQAGLVGAGARIPDVCAGGWALPRIRGRWTMFGDPAYRQAADRIFGFLATRWAALRRRFYASYA